MGTEKLKEKSVSGNGGKRPGAGRKKGGKNKATKEEQIIANEMKQRVLQSAHKLLNSQMNLAEGCQYLYKIEKTKITGPKGGVNYRPEKPKVVIDQWEIEEYLAGLIEEGDLEDENDPGATYYYLTTDKPDNKALDSLWDITFGKVPQKISNPDGSDLIPKTVLVKIINVDGKDK